MTEAGLTNSDTVDGSAWTRHRRSSDIHGELGERGTGGALKGISLNFDVLITRVITSSAREKERERALHNQLKATRWQCRPNKSGSRLIHGASYRGWNWQLCSCIPCTDIDRLRSRALFQSRKFPNRVCPSLRDDDYERYARRRPMDTAGIYQFPPISEPVIDASSPPFPSLLPRIIDISRRSSRDLVLDYDMKFFTDGGTLSFSPLSIFLIPFPFLSPFSRTEITIMYWRSKMMKGRKI